MPEIIIQGLGQTFGQEQALKGISFSVRDKEFLTLLGPSGCGKTTTLMSIAGFQRPDEGTISCGDRTFFDQATKVYLKAEDRNLGMVFQSYAIWPHLTVFGNVAFPLRIRRMKKDARRRKVLETLALVEMAGTPAGIRMNYPAASSRGWPWPGRWCTHRPCSCWTSRSPTLTPSCASGPGPGSSTCRPNWD